jgi:hypothetical protein
MGAQPNKFCPEKALTKMAFCLPMVVPPTQEENAMNRFTQRFADAIVSTLGCFDRVIFKGYLPFGGDAQLNRFVDHGLKMRRKDFLPLVEQQSQALVDHAKAMAQSSGAPYERITGIHSKEKLIQDIIRQRRLEEGLVAVLCVMETCRTVKLIHGQGRPRLVFARRPQRVLYYYFLDPDFGLIHLRLQSWFPFTLQVYVNGHDWLARQLHQQEIGFVQHDNAFTQIDEPDRAQPLADRFARLGWVKILRRWAGLVNPLLGQDWLGQGDYYWVIDQAEYSTDLLFAKAAALADLYPRLLDHAALKFSAPDILAFLGRRLSPRFDGEVLTTCKKDRQPGARIKHRVKNNWLKMYDKFGQILRIETVINQPREFRVRRRRVRDGQQQMVWCPMNKGVANFYHYQVVARAANNRYLDALAVVDPPQASIKQLDRVSKPAKFHGRRRRALHLLHAEEQKLFLAVLRGEHRLQGLRNRDVALQLFGPVPSDPAKKHQRTARVSRLLQLLRAHGLIAKVPHAHRYHLTAKGENLMNAAIYVRYKAFPKELQDVA